MFSFRISHWWDSYKRNKVLRFFINLIVLYAFWKVISYFLVEHPVVSTYWIFFNTLVADNMIWSAEKVFQLLNLDYYVGSPYGPRHIGIAGTPGVNVAFGCVAVPLMVLFTGLILAFPGKLRHKIWFIPLGVLGIHYINVSRILGLAFYVAYINPVIHNHKVYFNITAYSFIILMWIIWVNYFTKE